LYGRKTVYTDGALWYVDACRVEHVVYEQSLKNLMERMNEHTKGHGRSFLERAESQNLTM